ncbi:beta-carotene ketolase [Roseomonas hellenica]|uniref:Beta-carotene ketolase n=1 Tax=Plastoroseomonas hellenica TaxID=2687306 RepID=A0ABS5EWS1_9PROT|nr:beta-carotene ketolase [Plastoroseomonas hellenica]
MTAARQAAVGLALAAVILAAWSGLHGWAVFWHRWGENDWWRAPLLVVAQTWLSVGLFIVAHDAIHGSLAPGWPRLNAAVGQICVALYAGFSLHSLAAAHRRHHAEPGRDGDPDFHPAAPHRFAAWFLGFFRHYFGWRELAVLSVATAAWLWLGARPLNLVVFWALPALLSALQLFTFGTWLPHRHAEGGFADEHRARSLDYPWALSLLACFHFGRHREHHCRPEMPWWRLPAVKLQADRDPV